MFHTSHEHLYRGCPLCDSCVYEQETLDAAITDGERQDDPVHEEEKIEIEIDSEIEEDENRAAPGAISSAL